MRLLLELLLLEVVQEQWIFHHDLLLALQAVLLHVIEGAIRDAHLGVALVLVVILLQL